MYAIQNMDNIEYCREYMAKYDEFVAICNNEKNIIKNESDVKKNIDELVNISRVINIEIQAIWSRVAKL